MMTTEGAKMLSEYLIGNVSVRALGLGGNQGITNDATPYLLEIANKTYATHIEVFSTSINLENISEINRVLSIPADKREIPVVSSAKSAAKTHN